MGKFVELTQEKKIPEISALKKIFKQIDTQLIKAGEYQPGFAKNTSATNGIFNNEKYFQIYKTLRLAKDLKDYSSSHQEYKNNFTKQDSNIGKNMIKELDKACELAHIDSGECNFEKVATFAKNEIIKLQHNDTLKNDDIIKCIDNQNFDSMTEDEFVQTCVDSSWTWNA